MRKTLSLILVTFCISGLFAQNKGSEINIGTNYTIHSNILNEDREIQIHLPDSYDDSKVNYPVLYILDGQRFFSNGVAIQKSTKPRVPRQIPEMIVVGINSNRESRYILFGDDSARLTTFIRNEVIKFVDDNFKTTNERIIFGWEGAAFYISEMILKEKELFSAAIISNGGLASEELVKGFSSDKEIYLYIANSRKDIYTITQSDAFNDMLEKNNPKNLIWKYELFNDEVHQTMPYLAMYKGIRYYYHNFPGLSFESIMAYNNAGGIPYLKSYYKERSKRFGGDGKIEDGAKNGLIWLAWKRDNFEYFSFFMEEFKEVLSTERYASAYWQNRFGQFYLKHQDYDNAIKYFETGIKEYPNTQFDEPMKRGLEMARKSK